MQKKLLILVLALFFNNCETKNDSIGDFNEIVVATSHIDKELVYPYISSILLKYINTPLEEEIFKIKWIDAKDFFKYKCHSNILIVSLENPPDSTADKLFSKFTNSSNNENIFANYNIFAKDQIILTLGAYDSIELSDIINKHSEWVNTRLDEEITKRLFEEYKYNDINSELNKMIFESFNLDLYIDENYQLIKNNNDFIWIGRGYPYRWITIHKALTNDKDDEIVNIFKNLIAESMEDVIIVDDLLKVEYKNKVMIIRGLYEHNVSDTGGPFFTYIIKNNKNNELNFITGFVNNPGKSKYYLLKQLESMISLKIKERLK